MSSDENWKVSLMKTYPLAIKYWRKSIRDMIHQISRLRRKGLSLPSDFINDSEVDEWYIQFIAIPYQSREETIDGACRSYHVLSHVEEMFKNWEEYLNFFGRTGKNFGSEIDPAEEICLELSILFHDVIYDARKGDNEKRSVVWFKGFLNNCIVHNFFECESLENLKNCCSLDAEWVISLAESVSQWILFTKQHFTVEPVVSLSILKKEETSRLKSGSLKFTVPLLHVFLDLDLAILGSSSFEQYLSQYAQRVKKEYGYLGEEKYTNGRLLFLEKNLLAHPQWFKTPYFFFSLEEKARKNVQLEVEWHQNKKITKPSGLLPSKL